MQAGGEDSAGGSFRPTTVPSGHRPTVLSRSPSRLSKSLKGRQPLAGRLAWRICESRAFVIFGTVVTIWALAGDDLRLACTNKPADEIFDGLVGFCIVFFSLEILISCLGKDDYFPGFFFGLDVLSTATLFLDLTPVAEYMWGTSDDSPEDADKARGSRTARVGARVGRVVRVIRLVRIVKLYKVFASTRSRQTAPPPRLVRQDSAESLEEESGDESGQAQPRDLRESLVGKKLSAKTTQRTIILVLALLIVLPLLSMAAAMKTPASAEYGASEVHEAYAQMASGAGTRDAYEEMLLKYVYYHNWFTGHGECPREGAACSGWYYSQNFWVGIAGQADAETLRSHARQAELRRSKVEAFDDAARTQDNLYNFGTMPPEVLRVLSSPWSAECRVNGLTHIGFSVLEGEIRDKVGYVVRCPGDVRSTERETFTPRLLTKDEFVQWHFVFYFDLRPYSRQEAGLSMATTVFVCVVLCVASLCFSNDANTLVLRPVETMITKVEAIRDNPLQAMKMAEQEFKREENRRSQQMLKRKPYLEELRERLCCRRERRNELLETVILEKTIIKLGSLLALGFGEAGANIIGQNMKGADSCVDAMLEGTRVDCIMGSVRIRDFSTATEVLQEKVMTFVNQIAEIVHGVVNEFHGAANKNNGDTFLIIWRTAGMPKDKEMRLADMSIFAFAKILGGVHSSNVLAAYRFHPGLQQRLGSGCRVHLSFGLHCGWAIEGAIGSEYKIDASYLSPNVNIAGSVEHATRIYSVSILATQAVVSLCTRDMAAHMRLIDKVLFHGTREPLELYCVDLDYLNLPVDEPLRRPPAWNTQARFRSRRMLEARKHGLWQSNVPLADEFEDDAAVRSMQATYKKGFREKFNMGYQNYSQGEWKVARALLQETRTMQHTEDGPSGTLLRFMETPHQFEAPPGWQGVRDLGDLDYV